MRNAEHIMTLNDLFINLNTILPLVVLICWASLLLLVNAFAPKERGGQVSALLSALGLAVTLVLTLVTLNSQPGAVFGGMLVVDGFSNFLNVLLLLSGLGGIALAYDYLRRTGLEKGEYYTLLMFAISGMMLMGMSADLIMVFLALELLSIPLYASGIALPSPVFRKMPPEIFPVGAFFPAFS
jgi:NADH-quinone oxidoreductase subunit N